MKDCPDCAARDRAIAELIRKQEREESCVASVFAYGLLCGLMASLVGKVSVTIIGCVTGMLLGVVFWYRNDPAKKKPV